MSRTQKQAQLYLARSENPSAPPESSELSAGILITSADLQAPGVHIQVIIPHAVMIQRMWTGACSTLPYPRNASPDAYTYRGTKSLIEEDVPAASVIWTEV